MKAIFILLVLAVALAGCMTAPPVDQVAKRYEAQ